jgi:hypothetical protein
MTVQFDKPMLPSTKIVKYSDAIYKNRSNTLWMLRQNVHRERSTSALYDCGEPDEVTGVPVGTIALHKPAAISDEMENKAFKGP